MNIAALKRSGALKAALEEAPSRVVSLGCEAVDAACGGGLAAGAHQAAGQGAAPLGFGLAIIARVLGETPGGRALLVQAREAACEAGRFYAPGLHAMGIDPDRIGFIHVRTTADALRVVDETLRSGAAAVLADLGEATGLDLSATRRFNLSARRSGGLALLLTHDLAATSAALTRWRVEPRASRGRRKRLGRPTFGLDLVRNRFGPTGEWTLEWDSDDRIFRPAPPLPAPVARPAADRPDPARPAAAGEPAGAYRQAG